MRAAAMPRPVNLADAAKRHKRCAESLSRTREEGEACYLIGLAAECAVKHHLQQVNFPSRTVKAKADGAPDPLFLHFPDLAVSVFTQGDGIVAGRLLARLADQTILQGWSVKMRYQRQSSDSSMRRQFARWSEQTNSIFVEVGL